MAKKTLTPIETVKIWKEMMQRASLSRYYNVNGVLLSIVKTDLVFDKNIILTIPDKPLLELILKDTDIVISDESSLIELGYSDHLKLFKYGEDVIKQEGYAIVEPKEIINNWIPLDDNDIYTGKSINIYIDKDDSFPIIISKELLPIKLKKVENTDITYKIFKEKSYAILAIRKRFNTIDGYGFSMMRLFQII